MFSEISKIIKKEEEKIIKEAEKVIEKDTIPVCKKFLQNFVNVGVAESFKTKYNLYSKRMENLRKIS